MNSWHNEHGHNPFEAQHESHKFTVVIRYSYSHPSIRHIRCTSMAEAERIVRTTRGASCVTFVGFVRTVRPALGSQADTSRSETFAALAEDEES